MAEATLPIGVMRATPPAEVLEQMAEADAIHERLRARGYRVAFALSAEGGLSVELQDAGGEVLRTLSVNEAVELAAGRPLD